MKRIAKHPRRQQRRENAKDELRREPQDQLKYLDSMGYRAIRERKKLMKKIQGTKS